MATFPLTGQQSHRYNIVHYVALFIINNGCIELPLTYFDFFCQNLDPTVWNLFFYCLKFSTVHYVTVYKSF